MPSERDKTRRWRPWQFNLSTLLILTVTVALGVGWWVDHREMERKVNTLKMENDTLLIDQAIDAIGDARDKNEVNEILGRFRAQRPDLFNDRLKRGALDL